VLVLKVRELMTGTRTRPGDTLFLDALDEYRAYGHPREKVDSLANAIAAAQVTRWGLSCHAGDWRKGDNQGKNL